MSDTRGRQARVLITVSGGIATVSAVDGEVEVVLVDHDRDEAVSPDGIEATFTPVQESGTAKDFDDAVSRERADFERRHGERPGHP